MLSLTSFFLSCSHDVTHTFRACVRQDARSKYILQGPDFEQVVNLAEEWCSEIAEEGTNGYPLEDAVVEQMT